MGYNENLYGKHMEKWRICMEAWRIYKEKWRISMEKWRIRLDKRKNLWSNGILSIGFLASTVF